MALPSYYNQQSPEEEARRYIQPQFRDARRDMDTRLVNKGIMNSSMSGGQYQDLRNRFAQAESGMAQDLRRNYRDFGEGVRQFDTSHGEHARQFDMSHGENRRQFDQTLGWNKDQFGQEMSYRRDQLKMLEQQFGVEMGARIWEMLTSRELSKASLDEIPDWMRLPEDPAMFSDIQNQRYQPVMGGDPPEQQVGDPQEVWSRYSPKPWKSTRLGLAEDASAREDELLELQREASRLSRDRFDWDKQMAEGSGDDEEQGFRAALWEMAWEPLTDAEGYQVIDPETGEPVFKNNLEFLSAFAQSFDRDLYSYLEILRPELADHLKKEMWKPMGQHVPQTEIGPNYGQVPAYAGSSASPGSFSRQGAPGNFATPSPGGGGGELVSPYIHQPNFQPQANPPASSTYSATPPEGMQRVERRRPPYLHR